MAALSETKLTFPLPSLLSCTVPNNPKQTAQIRHNISKQFVAFYHHCQVYQLKDRPKDYRPLFAYHLDLNAKQILWKENGVSRSARKVVVACSAVEEKDSTDRWTFTFSVNGKEVKQEEFFLSGEKIIPVKNFSLPYFKGDEYEFSYFAENGPGPNTPRGDWDGWRFDSKPFVDDFRKNIYPLFEIGLQTSLSYLNKRALTLLDIGGHDGELSLRLIEKFSVIEKVFLVDSSHRAIEEIKNHKQGIFEEDEKKCDCYKILPGLYTKIEPFETDLRTVDFEKEVTQGKKMDIILISGVAAWGILTREESTALFKTCQTLLKDDGFIFVASASNPHFTKTDYQEFGYEVLNTSASKAYKDQNGFRAVFRPFYVLRKKNS